MPKSDGRVEVFYLGWRANGDGLDVGLAVNRLLAAGMRAWRISEPRPPADAGDYLVELKPQHQDALSRASVATAPWRAGIPPDAQALTPPATCLFAGSASKFPYFAYYALCLLRLGIDYLPCGGAALAQGALDHANLLVLPGGFATWGIDAAEDAAGADARVRDFLAHGGSAIGSCGGAFYLSAGRPGWTGTAAAKPLYTHEYLQSGVGIVTLAMRPGPLAFGCPPTIEVPYYHGPIYDALGSGIGVAATFHALSLPGRLAIDNPLDEDRFLRDMAGKPAILMVAGDRGHAVLFSPHPEMGDLIRKYIALDGYVRHYLPIRGFGTMRDTLRHYRVADAPSFRLVLNAVHELMVHARSPGESALRSPRQPGDELAVLCRGAMAALPELGPGEENDLLRDIAARIGSRLEPAALRTAAAMREAGKLDRLMPAYEHLATAIAEHQTRTSDRTPTQQLMELDLAVALLECWSRVAEWDLALARTT
jgi:hypothetical protein